MPIWNGEWGPVYQNASDGADYEEINETRYAVLRTQLDIYHKAKASWSIWLYKDIGFQGMVYVGEDTPYIKLMKPFLEKKKVRRAKSKPYMDADTAHSDWRPTPGVATTLLSSTSLSLSTNG